MVHCVPGCHNPLMPWAQTFATSLPCHRPWLRLRSSCCSGGYLHLRLLPSLHMHAQEKTRLLRCVHKLQPAPLPCSNLFSLFDKLTDRHGVYKVETIGDCYMACAGGTGLPPAGCDL